MAQSLNDFIAATTGKSVSFPNCSDNQCMTLMHIYLQDVYGLTDPALLANPSAYEVYTNYPQENGSQYFDRIQNTPEGVPSPGDLVIFNGNVPGVTGVDGHICIFVSGDVNNFTSFDCNFPTGSLPHLQVHTYDGVLGWLTPKPQGVFVDDSTYTKLVKEATEFEAFQTSGYFTPSDVVSKVAGYESQIANLQKQLGEANNTIANLTVEIQQNKDQMAKLADITQQQATTDSTAIDTGLQAVQSLKSITNDINQVVDQINSVPEYNVVKVAYPPVSNVTGAIAHFQNQLKAAQIELTRQAQANKAIQASQAAVTASKGFFSQVYTLLQKWQVLK